MFPKNQPFVGSAPVCKTGYIRSLDGLRLLASLNIVLMHLNSSWCLLDWAEQPILRLFLLGPAFNATLFFVLGGFIYFLQLSPKVATFNSRKFLISRIRKLYPLHVLTAALMVFILWYREEFFGDWSHLLQSFVAHIALLWPFAPGHWFSLNEPSWALVPFFLAYAMIGWPLRKLVRISSLRTLLLLLGACMLPTVLMSLVYPLGANDERSYEWFHIFPPFRVFEFFFGMVLARIFQVYQDQGRVSTKPWMRDASIGLGLFASWCIVTFKWGYGPFMGWFGPHVLTLVLFGWLIWNLAFQQGYIARLFANRWVSAIGRSSFYPYLLHLPLIPLVIISAKALGFRGFFHQQWQPILFLVLLYGLSALHVSRKPKKLASSVVKN